MLKIRLTRTGRKNQPLYRVVLAEHARPVKGKFIEVLGVYDPTSKQGEPKLEAERIKYWLGQGAQVSPRVAMILQKAGVVKGDEKAVTKALKKLAQKKAAMRKPKKEEEKLEEGGGEAKSAEGGDKAEDVEKTKGGEKKEEPKADKEAPKEEKPPKKEDEAEKDQKLPEDKKKEVE